MMEPDARIEPPRAVLEAARAWLLPVRTALAGDFLACYLTGSVLVPGFDPRRSRVNLLIVALDLPIDRLDPLAAAVGGDTDGLVRFEPLFVTRQQVEASLDVFPIEWLDIRERHLLLEGDDFLPALAVPLSNLRLQCEHELRGKHLRLRQDYLASGQHPEQLRRALAHLASGFHTMFRTLLRLRGETPLGTPEAVIERVAQVYGLNAQSLLGAHVVRHADPPPSAEQARMIHRRFLAEIETLVSAIDGLRVP
jgi:hypothetical protein